LVRRSHDLLEDLGSFLNTPNVVTAVRRQSGQDQTQARNRNDQQILEHDVSPPTVSLSSGRVKALVIQSLRPEAEVLHVPIAGLSAATPGVLLTFRRVYCNLHWVRPLHDVLSFGHLVPCAMSQKPELVGLERQLVFHDAVLEDANAVQPRARSIRPPQWRLQVRR